MNPPPCDRNQRHARMDTPIEKVEKLEKPNSVPTFFEFFE